MARWTRQGRAWSCCQGWALGKPAWEKGAPSTPRLFASEKSCPSPPFPRSAERFAIHGSLFKCPPWVRVKAGSLGCSQPPLWVTRAQFPELAPPPPCLSWHHRLLGTELLQEAGIRTRAGRGTQAVQGGLWAPAPCRGHCLTGGHPSRGAVGVAWQVCVPSLGSGGKRPRRGLALLTLPRSHSHVRRQVPS